MLNWFRFRFPWLGSFPPVKLQVLSMSTQRTVLVIGDSTADDREQHLQQDSDVAYTILRERLDSSILRLSQLPQLDGILLEAQFPKSSSTVLLRQLKEQMGDRCPPVVIIDRDSAEVAVQAFKNGAADYLVKDRMTPADLRLAMRSAIENAELRRKLQRSQDQFQTSVENMLDCFGIFSALRNESGQIVDFRIDYLNEAACENNRMPKEAQIGRGLCEVLPGHRESGLFDEYCRLVETGNPFIKDSLIYDDTYGDQRLIRAYDIRATRLNDGFVASWRDITARKHLEVELHQTVTTLQQQQRKLQRLIDTAPIGISVSSSTGNVLAMNDTMLRLYGYTRDEFERGLNWHTFVPADRVAQAEQLTNQLQQHGFFALQETERLNSSGDRIPLLLSGMKWLDDADENVIFAVDLTVQKRAEAEIQQLNHDLTDRIAELQSLFDIIPVGVAIATDASCTHMQNNAYLRQLLGVDPGSNISKSAPIDEQPPYRVFQDGQELPAAHLPMQVSSRLGVDVRDAEFDILLPDGSIRQILSYAAPLRDKHQQIRGVVGAFLDITERNRDAAALKASQQRYRELAEAMPQMVWTADATGAVNYWNQRWYEYTHLSEEESMRLAGVSTVHPEDRDRTLARWSEAIAHKEPFEIEYRIRHWQGEYHWFICQAVPTRNPQHQVTGWIGTITNIDVIKRSEALILQSEQQLQQQLAEIEAIYQSAPIGLNVLDSDLRFVRINQRLADINGLPIEAHIGQSVRDLFPKLADTLEQLLYPILETGEPLLNVEIQGETPAQPGVQRTWLEHFLPLKAGNRVIGISTVCEEITERIQVEAVLRQSEERFRTMADNAPAMIWVTDATGYCTYLNRVWYEFTGQTEATGLGFGWLNAVHPDDRHISEQTFLNAIQHQDAFRLEYRLRRQDGRYCWAIDAASPWFSKEGKFQGYIGSVIDISDRKEFEEALRLSEERYRTLFETMTEGFCVIEMLFDEHNIAIDYRFLEINPAFEQQAGLRDAVGKTAGELLPNLEPLWFEIYGKVALTGEPARFETRSDALDRWFEVSAFRIGPSGSQRVAILFRDISERARLEAERRQAEQEQQESKTRFRTLADNISQFAWMADENGHIFWYNQRWFEYTGTTLEDMQGWGWQSVHHPDHVGRVVQKIRRCFETGEVWEDTFPLRRRDGQFRWFLSRAIPVCNEQGEVLRWFGTNTDIHDQKELEIERDRLLRQEQMARESAEHANRIKDEFLAVLSHELRSPLNPILGWTKLLQTRKLSEARTIEALATIERNAKVQTQLIDDLLDVAKILRGKLSLNTTSVNLSSVVEAAIETVRTTALAKSITLRAELPNVGQVSGDPARLQQIVWNLVSNAIKFTPSGGQVTVQLAQVMPHPALSVETPNSASSWSSVPHAKITVTDTGKGINPEFLPHIFESFRQEDASITRKYGGLGLGLAIVRQLVEAHGGTICVDSPGEGLGATFTVQLPLLDSAPAISQTEIEPPHDLDLTGIRILAVDDDSDARDLLTALLTQYGAEVLTVSSAIDVLSHLKAFQPDVLVSDIGMPDVDGYALIQRIRALSPDHGGLTPAIALTAYAREDDHQKAIASGFQQHVAKPLEPEQLVQAVLTLVCNTSHSSEHQ